jgi:hypothetical protein
MLACSGLLLGAGVCPNSNVTSRTGTTIKTYILQRSNNTFYMESPSCPGSLMGGGLKFQSVRASCTSRTSGPGTWNSTNSMRRGLDCLSQKAHIRLGERIHPRSPSGSGRLRFQFRAMLSSVLETNSACGSSRFVGCQGQVVQEVNPRIVAHRRTSMVGTHAERVPSTLTIPTFQPSTSENSVGFAWF